jgi:peptidoglycan glycosyltransferase
LWAGFLVAFAVMMGAAAYWAIVGADSILLRDDNPRRVEFERRILRGAVFSADDVLLAQTTAQGNNRFVARAYPHPSAHSALGYFSFRYGASGAEQAYNALLRGDTYAQADPFAAYWREQILHQPRIGAEARLTLSARLQDVLYAQLAGHVGAGIISDAHTGALLAMVSLPTYDPNTLDADWEALTQAEGQPFFNRPTQGQYQMGGLSTLPLMALASLSGYDVTAPNPQAGAPVALASLTLTCRQTPASDTLSLIEAFRDGCPAPFVRLLDTLNADAVETFFNTLELSRAPVIVGWTAPQDVERPPVSAPFLDNVLGQGAWTANPLAVARLMNAVATDGGSPSFYMLEAVRPPQAQDWQNVPTPQLRTALLTAQTASALRDWLARATPIMGADGAQRGGGLVAIAYSGDDVQTWFVGYVRDGTRAWSILLVLEHERAQDLITDMAQAIAEALR